MSSEIASNSVEYTGAYRQGEPFLKTSGSFGPTNTIANNLVTGITASGAFEVGGTAGFSALNNTDELGNPLTF